MKDNEIILSMKGITKTFPGVHALRSAELEVKRGEVHALMGENGAGKSTMMKILFGILAYDAAEIVFDGKAIKNHNTRESLAIGISMIHQEITLAANMSISENIWAGREKLNRYGFVDFAKMEKETLAILRTLNLDFDPKTLVQDLSVAQMQMVEIARAVSYNSKLVIMDEPTSALTVKEIETLYNTIQSLKQKGVSVIIITHKIDEVFAISDRITVLRDGCYVNTVATKHINKDDLVYMMVGRELTEFYPKVKAEVGDIVLDVENIGVDGVFSNISFNVRKGEILGVSGLMGAGRTEIMRAIYGIDKLDHGSIKIGGKEVQINSPSDAIRNGLAMVTEDRKLHGLALVRSSKENITIANLRKYRKGILLNYKTELDDVQKMVEMLAIKITDPSQIVNTLSGGNQQKVIIAKWLLKNPNVLILDEPTRGVDVGAKSEIYRIISNLAAKGMAIIMVSSELPEILGMSDRIVIVHDRTIRGELSREEATQVKIMALSIKKERVG